MFVQIRQNFGRSALLLSGGGGLGIHHVGVLKALFEEDLLPRIIRCGTVGSDLPSWLGVSHFRLVGVILIPRSLRMDSVDLQLGLWLALFSVLVRMRS